MRVDIVDVLRLEARVAERKAHCLGRTRAVLERGSDVVCVTGRAVARHLGINLCAALQGVLKFLEHQNTRALADHETVPLLVKRNRSALRIFRSAERRELHETRHADRCDAGFRAAREHDVRIAVRNRAERLAHIVRAGSTGRHNVDVLALQPALDCDIARRHVADHHRDKQRIDHVRPLGDHAVILTLHRLQSADARTDRTTGHVGIFLREIQAAVRKRLLCRRDGKLRKTLHAARRFYVHKICRLEVLDFGGKFHFELLRVELGDAVNSDLSRFQRVPKRLRADTDCRHSAESGHNHSSLFHVLRSPAKPRCLVSKNGGNS